MKQYKTPAFTLVELMIVIAIIVLLGSIAIPNYMTYLAKAKQAEVAMNLASLHTAEELYWADHGTFTEALSGTDSANWQPAGYTRNSTEQNFYYTYGFNTPSGQEGTHYFVGKLGTQPSALSETLADKDQFVAAAAGILRKGGKPDIWVVDQNRTIRHLQDGLND